MAVTAGRSRRRRGRIQPRRLAGLSLVALGVVFGDIGTSPLYAMRESFEGSGHELLVAEDNILGILSLIFWSLVIIIAIKYLAVVMRADNDGEGGILALTALVMPKRSQAQRRTVLVLIGVFGTALLYGDGMITPAISVLSAVEGTEVATNSIDPYVVPIAVVILVVLFSVQSRGTGAVGSIFGPMIVVWFAVMGTLGIIKIVEVPEVLRALSPAYGVQFFADNGMAGFLALGSVFLVVTGGEALFADMGHFGRIPISLGWYLVVLPGLLLNYFGQGALLLADPEAIDNPFYRLAPEWALLPLVVLATWASIIASQALISGAFSLTHQAAQLGYLPRLQIRHTSAKERGQVYVPAVNWALMVGCVAMVIGFRSSTGLAAAYGVAVTLTMAITTIIFYVVARERFGWSLRTAGVVCGLFLVVDIAFFAANVPKIPNGGWFPLVVAGIVFTILTTWRTGHRLLTARVGKRQAPLDEFVESLAEKPPIRVPGTAVYLFSPEGFTPPALRANLAMQGTLHERVIVLTITTVEIPMIQPVYRLAIEPIGEGIERARLRMGFMGTPDVPAELARKVPEVDEVVYVLGGEEVTETGGRDMAHFRERLFALMHRNAIPAATYFGLPSERTVTVTTHVEI